MKKASALLILVCILAGCANAETEMERGISLRSKLLKADSCTFEADITADYGDSLHQFSLSCQANKIGSVQFTVTAPETIAGISGNITDGSGKLTFDDTALQFHPMTDNQISPVASPWIFLKTLRSGYLTSAGMDGELLQLSIDDSYEEDALHLDIWLDAADTPVRAEILYDGRRILTLNVKNFTFV